MVADWECIVRNLVPWRILYVMAGLDPAISYPHQFTNDAIPVGNHPMKMTGLILGSGPSPVMTGLDRRVRYVTSH